MVGDVAEQKLALRPKLRFRRDQFVAQLDQLVHAIAFRAPPTPLRRLLQTGRCVGGYAAAGSEAPVETLLAIAAEAGVATALPHFGARDAAMAFTAWRPGDPLEAGPWRVNQPVGATETLVPKLLLCPVLGFDRRGGRIGQGAGHYDRYFEKAPDTLRVGIAWSVQEVDVVPREPHDMPLDAVLTEQEWIMTGDRL